MASASRVWPAHLGFALHPLRQSTLWLSLVANGNSGEGDESEEEGKDEAPPELPVFQFSEEAMLPGQEYFQSENGLASLMRKVAEVKSRHLGVHDPPLAPLSPSPIPRFWGIRHCPAHNMVAKDSHI